MFRVRVSHNDKQHPHHAPFAAATGDSRDAVEAQLATVRAEYPTQQGYSHTVEELVDKGDGKSAWKAVS